MLEIILLLIIVLLLGKISYLTQQLNNYKIWEADINRTSNKYKELLRRLSNKERCLGQKYNALCIDYNNLIKNKEDL